MLFWFVLCAVAFGFFLIDWFRRFTSRGVEFVPKLPGPQSKFLFGNIFEFGDDPLHCISNFIEKYGLICQYWYYSEPVVLIADANLVEYVLSTNSSNYVKERDMFVADIVGNGLLVSQGEFWRKQRKIMVSR